MEKNVSKDAIIGKNVTICDGAIIEPGVRVGDGSYIDYRAILRQGVSVGDHCFVGADCILGEFASDFFADMQAKHHPLSIGNDAVIRSGTIMYGETVVGDGFQTGHRVTIREHSVIGSHVSIGTVSDLQGHCSLGDHVRLHSNVHLGQRTVVHDFAWIFPYVITTNDPTPPSDSLLGVEIFEYAVVCTGSVILPGKKIGKDAIVGAGAVVTKDVDAEMVVVGNPAKPLCSVRDIKDAEGNPHYPWRDYYNRAT